ncbi:MAG: response regulator [Acidobacteria bacterium]|nr:response regulator [Acidobacteriota bacterium]
MQIRIIRKFANFINDVDLSRVQVGDVITVPVRSAEMLIAEGWAVAQDARRDGDSRATNHASARSSTVLVVDDDLSMQGLLTLRLNARGYEVESAASADEAIGLLNTRTFDAIVLDVRMPGRSGLDVLRFIRRTEKLRNVPVLLLTGATLSPDEEAIVEVYPAYIFYKQENLEEFDIYLDRLTGHSSAQL